MSWIFYSIGAALLVTFPLAAAETVVLSSGYRMLADRHEAVGDVLRIYQGSGFTEIQASSVAAFEQDERPVVAPPGAVPPPVLLSAPVVPDFIEAKPVSAQDLAIAAAQKYSLPDSFVRSVMRAESNFRIEALSPKGAIGLMQLMGPTAKRLGVNPNDPKQNAEGGAQYLRELLARYQNSANQVVLALAAYNAGPEAVERFHGVPPYRETREYILRVLRYWNQKTGK